MNEENSLSSKRIVILGHGALGTVFGVALLRAGHNVVFLGRPPGRDCGFKLQEIRFVSLAGKTDCVRIDVAQEPAIVADADLVIVLVKTPDTVAAITRVAPFLIPTTPILTLQNGLRAADRIRETIGNDYRVIVGLTSQAATRIGPHGVVHTGAGPTWIGSDDAQAKPAASWIASLFTDAGVPSTVAGSIEHEIWQKAAVNAAINGPTALCGTLNGAVANEPELRVLALEISREAANVAASQGIHLLDIENVVVDTATATAANRSSMLQDIEAGRPTEADAIYGEIQRTARRTGIATPHIDAMSALIDGRSRMAGSRERLID